MKHDLRAISFDVFDTLLVRRICDPKAVFYFVGAESAKRGLIQMSPDAFRNARVEAERLSRMHVPDGEVDLEAIYKVLGRIIGCSSEQLHELMEIEISVEREMILPMPGARELVKAKRRAGYQIHFISEMYLPAEFLEEMLCKHGFMYEGRRTIVTDVVRENNGTYRLGYTEMCKDATKMGCGLPEYLLLFRKPPTDVANCYADEPVSKNKSEFSLARWQIDAAAFWQTSPLR